MFIRNGQQNGVFRTSKKKEESSKQNHCGTKNKQMNYKEFYSGKQWLVFLFLSISCLSYGQQKVVRLYQGKAPGSENWAWQEQTSDSNAWRSKIVFNVVEPSLTVFPAQGESILARLLSLHRAADYLPCPSIPRVTKRPSGLVEKGLPLSY